MARMRLVSPDEWLKALAGDGYEFAVDEYYHGYHRTRRAAPQSSPQQTLPKHCMKMSVHGTQTVAVAGRDYRLDPGAFLWVPPGATLTEPGAGSYACYHLRFDLGTDAEFLQVDRGVVFLADAWELLPYFKQLVVEADTTRWGGGQRLRSLMSLLCIGVFRLLTARRDREPLLSDDQCQRLATFFAEHAHERLAAADLARVVNLSPDYFTRIFGATFGDPPRTWMVRQRMRLAAERLKSTTLSVKEIAYALGYDDVYLFSRQFRSFMGMSPRSFRGGR